MDKEQQILKEILSLSADTLALQTVLTQILLQLRKQSPALDIAVGRAIDDAASAIEHLAIRFGEAASPAHTVKALRIVEELRDTVGYKTSRAASFNCDGTISEPPRALRRIVILALEAG